MRVADACDMTRFPAHHAYEGDVTHFAQKVYALYFSPFEEVGCANGACSSTSVDLHRRARAGHHAGF